MYDYLLTADEAVSEQCVAEMSELRQSLMEDYQISPEIVASCGKEITDYCGNGVERGGKTIHCLMAAARPKHDKHHQGSPPEVGAPCMRAVSRCFYLCNSLVVSEKFHNAQSGNQKSFGITASHICHLEMIYILEEIRVKR